MEEGKSNQGLDANVLVLNKLYQPIQVINARRAFILLCKASAEIIDKEDSRIVSFDFWSWYNNSDALLSDGKYDFVKTPSRLVAVPKVIRLLKYDKIHSSRVRFNRRNIIARDNGRCQYCGRKFPVSQLSIDHIIPKSRGGTSNWLNVVTACPDCNTKKGGKLLEEVGMKLIQQPKIPKKHPVITDKIRDPKYEIWKDFI